MHRTAKVTLQTIRSEKLLQVLALTERQVKIMCGSEVIDRVSAAEAIRLAKLREYEGIGTPTRVRIMRLTGAEQRRELPWQPCYRTQESAVLPPSVDWLAHRETHARALA